MCREGRGGGIDDEDMLGSKDDTSAACFSYMVAYYRLWNDVIRSNMGAPERLLNDMSCLPLEPSSKAKHGSCYCKANSFDWAGCFCGQKWILYYVSTSMCMSPSQPEPGFQPSCRCAMTEGFDRHLRASISQTGEDTDL